MELLCRRRSSRLWMLALVAIFALCIFFFTYQDGRLFSYKTRVMPFSHATDPAEKTPSSSEPPRFAAQLPQLIWQTASVSGLKKWANQSATWKTLNPEHEFTLLSDKSARDFVFTHFAHRPAILQFWDNLNIAVSKADFLRYLIMLARGGIYSDIDTSNLIPITSWIPAPSHNSSINAIVAIEYDDTTYKMFVRPISFTQWTLAAAPNHPIFARAVARVMSNLEFFARRQRVELRNLSLGKLDVLEATGPGMYTDVVMEVLRDRGLDVSWAMFQDMKEPVLLGDVLVLPVNAFCGGQKHSHSGDPAYGEMLVRHHFGRSWYTRPTDGGNLTGRPTGGPN